MSYFSVIARKRRGNQPTEFPAGWAYRKPVSITNNDIAKTEQPWEVVVPYSGNMDSDFADIRFTDSSGTPLDFALVEYVASTSARFFVKVDDTIGNLEEFHVYVYYGNGTATYAGDGSLVFDEYITDFSGVNALQSQILPNGTEVTLTTYDGSGQTAHPSVIDFLVEHSISTWSGHRYWMANTPYPGGNDNYENPSIWYSDNGTTWTAIAGNPIAPAPANLANWNADTEIIYNPDTDELWCYFMFFEVTETPAISHLKLIKSSDGVTWGTPVTTQSWNVDTYREYVSPSVVRLSETDWHLWMSADDDYTVDHFTSIDGVAWTLSPQNSTVLAGYWHGQIKWVTSLNKYICLYTEAKTLSALYYAESFDGIVWTTAKADNLLAPTYLMAIGGEGTFDRSVYRPSFVYNSGELKVWYGAQASNGVWSTGYTSAADITDVRMALTCEIPSTFTTGGASVVKSAEQIDLTTRDNQGESATLFLPAVFGTGKVVEVRKRNTSDQYNSASAGLGLFDPTTEPHHPAIRSGYIWTHQADTARYLKKKNNNTAVPDVLTGPFAGAAIVGVFAWQKYEHRGSGVIAWKEKTDTPSAGWSQLSTTTDTTHTALPRFSLSRGAHSAVAKGGTSTITEVLVYPYTAPATIVIGAEESL